MKWTLRVVVVLAWLAMSVAVIGSAVTQRHDPGRQICAVVVSEQCR